MPRRSWARLARGLLALAFAAVAAGGADAQSGGIQWSEPVNLSASQAGSAHPAIVADPYGFVHVFWSEDMNGEPVAPDEVFEKAANTIMYRRWDGTSWSEPVDVLAIAGEAIAEFIAVDIGPDGRLHAVWTGQSNIYYSSASAWEAGNVHAWTAPVAIAAENARSAHESAIAVTPDGGIHVIYATRNAGAGVYHITSGAEGVNWRMPTRISADLALLEKGYANVKLVSDREGRLHATWQTFEEQGFGQGIYYSRSLDGGITWSTPLRFSYREAGDFSADFPYLTVGANADLYLIYVDAATTQGRAYRISRDSGETWSEPRMVITELEGINGYVIPLLDGAGQTHLIANMRTREGGVVGIYYTRAEGDGFMPPVAIAVGEPYGPSAHYTATAVRLGSEIHIVWNQLRGAEIWHMRGEVRGLQAAAALTIPTPAPVAPRAAQPAAAAATPAASPTPARVPAGPSGSAQPAPSPLSPMLIGVLPAVLLVLGVVLWTRLRPRR